MGDELEKGITWTNVFRLKSSALSIPPVATVFMSSAEALFFATTSRGADK